MKDSQRQLSASPSDTAASGSPANASVRSALPESRRTGHSEPQRLSASEVVARWDDFKVILDARSPGEFAIDHLPGAINTPVLNDREREHVGRINAEQGAFAAKRLGAALVARNIGALIEDRFAHEPRQWAPLVYCWRGGQRSGSLATVLARIGWPVQLIEGGYKAFRQAMLEDLNRRSAQLNLVVIAGRTGTAKTQLLQCLHRRGAQVIDLEALACHRGSVLGQWPAEQPSGDAQLPGRADTLAITTPQPSQKRFESTLWAQIRGLDPSRPIFVESESRKIGQCQVPEALILAMRRSPMIQIEASLAARTQFLVRDYAHLCQDDSPLIAQLQRLIALHGRERVEGWITLAREGAWPLVVEQLLIEHYDPAYDRSIARNFSQLHQARRIDLPGIDETTLNQAASQILNDAKPPES